MTNLRNDYKWELVLFVDSESYNCHQVISTAQQLFDVWCYVLHDRDLKDDGSLKKPHYHFYGKFANNRYWTPQGVAYHLGLPDNLSALANISSWKGAIRYTIHLDYPSKAQYEVSSVVSNFNLTPYIDPRQDDDVLARQIYDYLKTESPSLNQAVDYCLTNGLWSAFRRGFSVWSKIINGG